MSSPTNSTPYRSSSVSSSYITEYMDDVILGPLEEGGTFENAGLPPLEGSSETQRSGASEGPVNADVLMLHDKPVGGHGLWEGASPDLDPTEQAAAQRHMGIRPPWEEESRLEWYAVRVGSGGCVHIVCRRCRYSMHGLYVDNRWAGYYLQDRIVLTRRINYLACHCITLDRRGCLLRRGVQFLPSALPEPWRTRTTPLPTVNRVDYFPRAFAHPPEVGVAWAVPVEGRLVELLFPLFDVFFWVPPHCAGRCLV